jgi:nucleoside-diphosphate-sugar epimerase
MTPERVLVTGAGGFIGHHLVVSLKRHGAWVRGVDLHPPEFAPTAADEFTCLDLRRWPQCLDATAGVDTVYALAADMGGMGFISTQQAAILHNNLLINTHTLEAARQYGVRRYFFSSSACVYPVYRQEESDAPPLREADAFPAQPDDAYGWEKLTTEQLCLRYRDDHGMDVRIARLHNVFGPLGTWCGGREKAPAALCRKVALAKLTGDPEIEIWGDGRQTRSFLYIDDCIAGIHRVMQADVREAINLGHGRAIAITELVDLIADIAGVRVVKRFVEGPQGVRGRNCDGTRMRDLCSWEPRVSLEEGLAHTYAWIEARVRAQLVATACVPSCTVPTPGSLSPLDPTA